MNWKLFPTISAPMPFQMAFDELLFESQKKESQAPSLRFYVSSEPWISVGCSFKGTGSVSGGNGACPPSPFALKSELIRRHSHVPVCRRITGGGCVLHGHDLIFSLIAPCKDPVFVSKTGSLNGLESVRKSYAKIHEGVKMGLQQCGLDPKFYGPEDSMPKGNDCFDFPVESDLSWKGKKIAGGAQKRSEGVLLHHESVLIPPGVDRDGLIRALKQGMEKVFEISIQNADLDPEIYFQAEKGISGK